MPSRSEQWKTLFPTQPKFRWTQIEKAFFDANVSGWDGVTTLPKAIRPEVAASMPWMSVSEVHLHTNKRKDTYKAVVAGVDGQKFETVLMKNRRDYWTICVSSQIGCAMKCAFCATGTMGLKRSLSRDEILDQYRYWIQFLKKNPNYPQRISNIVFMGMGEPLANYDEVKASIKTILENTDIGPTRITVSSVGILPQLEKVLTDTDWPPVRIAISLHSAVPKTRSTIVPTTVPDFLKKLSVWAKKYHEVHGNRRHHVTFEYVMLKDVNDSRADAEALAEFVHKAGGAKVNVIPYNPVLGKPFTRTFFQHIRTFKEILRKHEVDVTQRKTMGDDIAAACGQLVVGS